MNKRIAALRNAAFRENGFEGHLIFNSTNLLYFLGISGTTSLFIPVDGKCTIYVYGVNYEQAKSLDKGFNVQLVKSDENLMAKIASKTKGSGVRRLVIDALGVESWHQITKELPSEVALEVSSSYVQALRIVKDGEEIKLMRKAGDLTSEGMKTAAECIKPGMKEFEVAAEIEDSMRKRGAGPAAFESIVASGACSAFPHGGCSERRICEGDLVVVDIGASYKNYCSDMTRTFVAGKPSAKQLKIYEVVKTAQEKAFNAIKAGVIASAVDLAARRIIEKAGYGEFFVHRLGHGVGLEVHELPTVGPTNKETLSEGYVITDEPGIYLPSFGGVRIEDTVLVTKSGAERITEGPYTLGRE